MRVATLSAALTSFVATVSAAGTLTINSPTVALQECHPVSLTWTGGTAPYYLEVTGSSVGDVLEELNPTATNANSGSWLISQPSGQKIVFVVTDSTGTSATTGVLDITAGTDTSCLGQVSFSAGGSAYTAAGTGAPAAGASTAAASAGATTAAPASGSGAKTASAASKATSAASSAASAAAASASTSASAGNAVQGSIAAAVVGAIAAFFI